MPKPTLPKQKYYAVKIGKQPGIYPCWEKGAKEQVAGIKGAVFKSFKTLEEAQIFMDRRNVTSDSVKLEREWQLSENIRVKQAYKDGYLTNLGKLEKTDNLKKMESLGTHMASIDGARALISAVPLETLHPRYWNRHQGSYYIFTDGSFMPAAKHVGYGICLSVGNSSSNSNSDATNGASDKQLANCLHRIMPIDTTNNQCEMLAIASVLQIIWMFRDYFGKPDTHTISDSNVKRRFLKTVTIISDSSYCINSITKWVAKWSKNNWLTANGDPVKNRDTLEKINELCQQLEPFVDIYFQHTNSHLTAPDKTAPTIKRLLWEGNYMVDLAAKQTNNC